MNECEHVIVVDVCCTIKRPTTMCLAKNKTKPPQKKLWRWLEEGRRKPVLGVWVRFWLMMIKLTANASAVCHCCLCKHIKAATRKSSAKTDQPLLKLHTHTHTHPHTHARTHTHTHTHTHARTHARTHAHTHTHTHTHKHYEGMY